MKLGDIAVARSGDKGDTLNIAVIVRKKEDFPLLERALTPERVREYFSGMVKGEVERFVLPEFHAVNLVLHSALDGGVTASRRLDRHGKTLSGYLLEMPMGLDYRLKHYRVVDSTNDIARKLAEKGAPEGTVVWAEEQTRGRGRKGDLWESGKGGLYFSIILRPEVKPGKTVILPLLTGMAVHRVVRELGVGTRIKLPNDVIAKGKKLCGILCENSIIEDRVRYVIVGVGINVSNPVPEVGISLKNLIGAELPLKKVLEAVLEEFERDYMEFLSTDYLFEGA